MPVVGRERELSLLRGALKDATVGKGGAVFITGEPGLGKTRLVQECRKLFIAWVGAASGRLPLWLEGRAASYATLAPTVSTSSCCQLGWALRPKRAHTTCEPPWRERCKLSSAMRRERSGANFSRSLWASPTIERGSGITADPRAVATSDF